MAWEIEVSNEFKQWYEALTDEECGSVNGVVDALAQLGPALGRPQVDTLKGSRYPNMKELRIQHQGRPYRILFAFDPRRCAYLICGGDKTGDALWYGTRFGGQTRSTASTLKKLEVELMSHKWRDIRRTLSPQKEEETRQYVKSVVEAVTLNQLREARSLTQANLASILGINQGSVSKMEKRTDMYVSTLRSFIQAMGGQLQIKAIFPEGDSGEGAAA